MITLHGITAGSGVDYLLSTVQSEDSKLGAGQSLGAYMEQGGDSPGQWLGAAAGLLGLHGTVDQAAADAVFKLGVDPVSGEVLGRRFPQLPSAEERYERLLKGEPQASPERRAALWAKASKLGNHSAKSGWEMVFTPVKSFGTAWGLADDDERQALAAAEQTAFERTLSRIEREVAWTRIGAGGAAQVQADGLLAAVFVHRSSRAGDPNYHRHLAISSKVPFTDPATGARRWLTIDSPPLHAMTVALSEFYTAELERAMQGLGYLAAPRADVEPGGKRPVREYVGVPAAAVVEFSSRRRQTEQSYLQVHADFVAREGREPTRAESYRMYQTATLVDRPEKVMHTPEQERTAWRERAAAVGIEQPGLLGRQMAQASAVLGRAADPAWREHLAAAVIGELAARRASWRRSNVEAEVTRQIVAAGAHLGPDPLAQLVRAVVDEVLGSGGSLRITLPEPVPAPAAYRRADGESVFRRVNGARYTSTALLDAEAVLVAAATTPALVRRIAAADVDRVLDAGNARRGFAPSAQQRAVVRAVFDGAEQLGAVLGRAGTGKTTVMRMVREVADAHGIAVLGLSTGQVQADNLAQEAGIRAENTARWLLMSQDVHPGDPEWTLPAGALVIVDEAGQSGTMHLTALLGQVQAAGGRLLLVGDHLQTGSVEAGGILAELEHAQAPVSVLDEVQRFRDRDGQIRRWETKASIDLAHGRAEDSYTAYEQHGRLHHGQAETMADTALTAYLRDVGHGLASILIVPDNATAAMLSARVREQRIRAGLVRTGRQAALSDGNAATIGDVVATRRNDRDIATRGGRGYVRNGDTWTVQQVQQDGTLVVRDRISGAIAELPPAYVAASVTLAYAVTQHRAQGLTVDTAHALVTDQMSRNALYPALTRGRYENHAYLVTTKAMDLEHGEPGRPTTPRHVWTRVLERAETEQAAAAAIRTEQQQAAALSGLYQRLRYTLDDLGDTAMRTAAAAALGPEAEPVTAAAAWPALAELLRVLHGPGGT